MARTRFSWTNVDPSLTRRLLRIAYQTQTHPDPESADAALTLSDDRAAQEAARVLREPPSVDLFVRQHCGDEFRKWLTQQPAAVVIATAAKLADARRDALPLSTKPQAAAYLDGLRLSKTTRTVLRQAFLSAPAHRVETDPSASTKVKVDTPFRLASRGEAAFAPYLHQREAWKELDTRIALPPEAAETMRGLIVLPTGAGKTSTTTEWLAARVIAEHPDVRVLWLAHQIELLEQARRSLANAVARLPAGRTLRGRVIGGAGDPVSTLSDSDLDVAFVSIQSLVRDYLQKKRQHLTRFATHPTIVVVDEAHHAGASGYDRVLDDLAALDVIAILGLTATPRPTGLTARAVFNENFPTTIYSADPSDLVSREILAQPVIHSIDSGISIVLDPGERRQYAALRDLPPSVLQRLDRDERNRILRDEYLQRQDDFGATLVFAANRVHADRLGETFSEVVETKVLHGGPTGGNRAEVLEWFGTDASPKVLVSVGMLTEGVDLPHAKAAILARPTTSHVLLRQMVGRAMRGLGAGGSREAHVLHLIDDFDGAPDILNPAEVIPYATTTQHHLPGTPERRLPPLVDNEGEPIPPGVEAELRRFQSERDVSRTITAIIGYYAIDDRLVPVMSHQQDAFEELISWADNNLQGTPAVDAFKEIPPPIPTALVISEMLDYVRANKRPPALIPLAIGSPVIDVADELDKGSRSEDERVEIIRQRYEGTLARAAFPTLADFRFAVEGELARRRYGGLDDVISVHGRGGTTPLPRADRHLDGLRDEVVEWIMQHVPHLGSRLEPLPEIDWSTRVNQSLFGSWTPVRTGRNRGAGRIRINRLLATTEEAVSNEMLKYLIYHELLHHLLPLHGHDPFFRSLEARWPDATELDHAYDTLHERWNTNPEAYREPRRRPGVPRSCPGSSATS